MSEENNYARQSSSSSLNSSCHDTEDDKTIANILSKEICESGTLGRRLSHLDSIPHQPRVNGAIPDLSNATLDHERLSERLTTYGLAELQIEGDGNCQFRAIADQLFRNPDYHKHVRKEVVKQLKHFQKLYEGYVPMSYKSYLKKMKRCGEWGDHVTLQAAADRFGAKICLLTSFRDTCLIEIMPKDQNSSRAVACTCCSGCCYWCCRCLLLLLLAAAALVPCCCCCCCFCPGCCLRLPLLPYCLPRYHQLPQVLSKLAQCPGEFQMSR